MHDKMSKTLIQTKEELIKWTEEEEEKKTDENKPLLLYRKRRDLYSCYLNMPPQR